MKWKINPFTSLPDLTGDGGGGGGDGVKKINGVSPNTQGQFNLEFDNEQFTVEQTTNGLKISLKSAGTIINSISLNGTKIPIDSEGNIPLVTENGIEGNVE